MSGTRGDSCDTLDNCFYFVMQSFFAGADATTDLLDILYGIIVIVVLLNVVIAIVEQGEEKTTPLKNFNLANNSRQLINYTLSRY